MAGKSLELMQMSSYEGLSYRIVEFQGILESSAMDKMDTVCQAILASGIRDVIFNLNNVSFISNAVIDHLLLLSERFNAQRGNLFLMNVSRNLRNRRQLVERLRVVKFVKSEEEAECEMLTRQMAYCF